MMVHAWFRTFARPLAAVAVIAVFGGGCAFGRLGEGDREAVLAHVLPSAVQVVLEHPEGRRFRTGSGVVIASRPTGRGVDCFVLTSGHTVAGAVGQKAIYLLFGRHRGEGTKASATVVVYRETADLDVALLRAERSDCVPARPGPAPRLGEPIWVITFPWGRNLVLAGGIVSQVGEDGAADPASDSRLMVDASVSYGSSGGGVYEARGGGLVGLVEGYRTARVTSQGSEKSWYIDVPMPGQTLVTPLAEIRRFLAEAGHADLLEGALPSSSHAAR